MLTFILKKQTYFTGSYFNSTSPSFSDHGSALAGGRVAVASQDRRHRTRRAERRERTVAFSAAGATCRRPGHENRFPRARLLVRRRRAGQTPSGQRRKRLFDPSRRTAAPSLSDLPGRHVELAEPRPSVPVPARCDQRSAGDGGERAHNLIFKVLAFPTTDPPKRADGWS